MRTIILLLALAFLLYGWMGHRTQSNAAAFLPDETATSASNQVDFETQIKPIFQSKCMPCHFSGGQMYSSLPFDRPETIKKLGDKVFTRIKDENHRRLIREFLTQ
ncbi:MAG TPA: hypothetical protein VNO50_06530 [Pyrinomonadaceae bacterium]|nr:hypothetical protein [Pyrinomonadaceae bacterium]